MYDTIAHYYDLIHADLREDVPYILDLAAKADGPVLELGCGSGRLLLPLALAGHRTTGLDNSAAMLSRARDRMAEESREVRQRVRLIEADMTSFELAGEREHYVLAIFSYNTLMHLSSQQVVAALKCTGRHLKSQGQLFIDLTNPAAIAQTPNDRALTLEKRFVDLESGDVILQLASNWLEEPAQLLHITWMFDAVPAAGGPVSRTVAQADYHFYYPHQLELLLTEAGFRLSSLAGDYLGNVYKEESERLLLLATKA
jgi:SAM-dependent methyltransferase